MPLGKVTNPETTQDRCYFCSCVGPLVRSPLGQDCCENCRQFQQDLLTELDSARLIIEERKSGEAAIIQRHAGTN